jgi:phosphoesterase RecJ-like protein
MKFLTRIDTADWLLERDRFAILTHRKPDGDTIGSAAGLCRGLRQLGKTAYVLHNPEVTERLAPLLEGITKESAEEGDVIVAVDVAADHMLPKVFDYLRNSVDLRIDHHGSGTDFAPNSMVDGESASCAELIWDILMEMGVESEAEVAEPIYVGTATDTGCFRFANTTAHTFDTAGDCAAAGVDIYTWNQLLFETNSLERLRLQGWVAEHTKLFSDGKLAICALPKAVEEEIGVDEDDMGNLSSFIRTIEGVRLAALLRETDSEDVTKMSLRAVPGWDAAAVCAKFGGGGHKGAAGASMKLSLEEAAKAVKAAMLEI